MLTIRSSGISCPLSMKLAAVLPSSVPFLISARSTSPVEMWFSPYFSIILSLCVPLPDPGAPKITIFFMILILFLFMVLFVFYNRIDVLQFTSLMVIIQTIAHDEVVGNAECHVVELQILLQLVGFEEKCADVD